MGIKEKCFRNMKILTSAVIMIHQSSHYNNNNKPWIHDPTCQSRESCNSGELPVGIVFHFIKHDFCTSF